MTRDSARPGTKRILNARDAVAAVTAATRNASAGRPGWTDDWRTAGRSAQSARSQGTPAKGRRVPCGRSAACRRTVGEHGRRRYRVRRFRGIPRQEVPIPPPTVALTPEHDNRITRLLDKKIPVKLAFNVQAQIIEDHENDVNVIADIEGGRRKTRSSLSVRTSTRGTAAQARRITPPAVRS